MDPTTKDPYLSYPRSQSVPSGTHRVPDLNDKMIIKRREAQRRKFRFSSLIPATFRSLFERELKPIKFSVELAGKGVPLTVEVGVKLVDDLSDDSQFFFDISYRETSGYSSATRRVPWQLKDISSDLKHFEPWHSLREAVSLHLASASGGLLPIGTSQLFAEDSFATISKHRIQLLEEFKTSQV